MEFDFKQARFQLNRLHKDAVTLSRLDFLPAIGETLKAAKIKIGGANEAAKIFLPVVSILAQNDGSVADISQKSRREIVFHLAQNSQALALAVNSLEYGSLPFWPPVLDSVTKQLRELSYIAPELPQILGMNGDVRYLVILANNLEIRPAGGFIGTYALVTLRNGEILDFSVRDSYLLPGEHNPKLGPPAPAVMQKYLGIEGLPFRDGNWYPDYPTSARFL